MTVVAVLIFADRTKPSFLLVCTSRTRPRGHDLLAVFSSGTKTISLTSTFLRDSFHFCLARMASIQEAKRRQNRSARYATCRQRRTLELSFLENFPGGMEGPGCSNSRWFGVNASTSFGSSDTFVIGRRSRLILLRTSGCSALRRPLTAQSLTNALNTFLTVLIHRSHTPPWREPAGGLNIHVIFFCSSDS